jgi:hypothetical protein
VGAPGLQGAAWRHPPIATSRGASLWPHCAPPSGRPVESAGNPGCGWWAWVASGGDLDSGRAPERPLHVALGLLGGRRCSPPPPHIPLFWRGGPRGAEAPLRRPPDRRRVSGRGAAWGRGPRRLGRGTRWPVRVRSRLAAAREAGSGERGTRAGARTRQRQAVSGLTPRLLPRGSEAHGHLCSRSPDHLSAERFSILELKRKTSKCPHTIESGVGRSSVDRDGKERLLPPPPPPASLWPVEPRFLSFLVCILSLCGQRLKRARLSQVQNKAIKAPTRTLPPRGKSTA